MLPQRDINKRFRFRIIIFSLTLVGILLIAASYGFYRNQLLLKKTSENEIVFKNRSELSNRALKLAGEIKEISASLAENQRVSELLHKREYELLTAEVESFQNRLGEKYNFSYFLNFYFPDQTLFLSSNYKEELFVSPRHSLVRKVTEKESPFKGHKIVDNDLYFKIVSPVFHNGSFSGLVEFGLRDKELIEYFQKGINVSAALYFPKTLFPLVNNILPGKSFDFEQFCLKIFENEGLFLEFYDNDRQTDRFSVRFDQKHYIIEDAGIIYWSDEIPLGGLLLAHDTTHIFKGYNRAVLAGIFSLFFLVAATYIAAKVFAGRTVSGFSKSYKNLFDRLEEKNEKITESALEVHNIFNSTATAIRVINKDFQIIRINNSYAKNFKLNPEKTEGKKCYDYWPESRCHKDSCPLTRIMKGEKNIESEIVKPDKTGKEIAGIQTCIPLYDEKGNLKGMVEDFRDISERKKTEDAIIKSEKELKNFIYNLPLGVFIKDSQSRPFYHNRYMDEVFCRKNCTENTPHELFPGKIARLERDEDKKVLSGENIVVEKILPDKNGRERIYMVHKFAMKEIHGTSRIGGIYIDITKRKEAEYKLRILSRAIRYSPVCVVITDPEGNIEFVNPAFTHITGYSFAEVMGKNMNIVNSGKHKGEFFMKMWKTIKSGKDWQGEILNRKKDGTLFWEKVAISAIINNKGKITHFVAIKDDITKSKEAEEQIKKAKEKAEESDRLKTTFLANMSHEIRTPMNAIVGLSRLLVDTGISLEERKSFTGIINENSQTLLKLIEDIIDISKIEAGQISINKSECQLNQLLDEILNTFKSQIEKQEGKRIRLSAHKGLDNTRATIITDPHRLRQILFNLIGNSCKFTDKGSVDYGYELSDSGKLKFYVKDTGIGISKDKTEIIFNRFRQAEDSTTRNYGGAGLGLTISKSLVEILGGEIWVNSIPGEGTIFYFTLPYQRAATKKPAGKVVQISKGKELSFKEKTILVAEDIEANYRLIEALLKKTDATVLWARDGEETIEMCRRKNNIDLVLLDINMPGINGYEALVEIKKLKTSLPVIMQTAYAMPGEEERFIKAGCDGYITKPINSDVFLNTIRKCLETPL